MLWHYHVKYMFQINTVPPLKISLISCHRRGGWVNRREPYNFPTRVLLSDLLLSSSSPSLSPSLLALLPPLKPCTFLWQEWCNLHADVSQIKRISTNMDHVFPLPPLRTNYLLFLLACFVGSHNQTASVQQNPEEILSRVQKVDCATTSRLLHDVKL